MKNIADFLAKFKVIRDPQKNRELVIDIINKIVGITIQQQDTEIEKGVVRLHVHPAFKNKIFLKKPEIIEKIKIDLPDLHISDIQ